MNRCEPKTAEPEPLETIHSLVTADVYKVLSSSTQGLAQSEADERLQRAGRNIIRGVKRKPLYLKFVAKFTHLMALLLWTGGGLAFIGHLPQLGWAIWSVVVINAVFSFLQEYRAERAMEALKRLLPVYTRVLRDGEERRLPAEELVPGDVMLLAEGDRISADGRLVLASELRIDQSTLSGESHALRKTTDVVLRDDLGRTALPNLVFAGTSVASGTGRAVVFATGMLTEFGKIAHLTLGMEEETSPLQREINNVSRLVAILAVGIGIIFFLLSVFVIHRPLDVGFIFAVGMIVAFVPEGLLPTVTLALALAVQRMAKRNALVKKLSAVETLGSCSVICTDKTGTLTQNEMTVCHLWVGGQSFTITGTGYAPEGEILSEGRRVPMPVAGELRLLLLASGLCNDSRIIPPDENRRSWTVLGDPTEAAMRVVAEKGGLELEMEEKRSPRIRELAFDSRRKRMSTLHKVQDDDGAGGQTAQGLQAYVKGAPREILSLCTRFAANGEEHLLSVRERERIMNANDDFAGRGLRVLAVAARRLPVGFSNYSPEAVERDLTFVGLMAMMDPPRPEVAAAVGKCHRAGIRIIMVTGDYGLTAESIARRIGIIGRERPRIISGTELDGTDNRGLEELLDQEVVFARVAPEHKLRVVSVLQAKGHMVAVTGDGVNDAPALKKADIGVAMGMAGTEVAKEAADMVLADDNFASIVYAIEEGRAVYANIKKFVTYIFSSNVPEAWPFIAQIMFNIPLALPVMQILAIDLGTDIVPALALGTEAPEPDTMDRGPRKPDERLVDRQLLMRSLLWLGNLQSVLCFFAFFFLYHSYGYRDLLHLPRLDLLPFAERLTTPEGHVYVLSTAIFLAGVIATQIGNAYACRTSRASVFRIGLFSNRFLLMGIFFELFLVNILIYIRPVSEIFELAPLPAGFWLLLAVFPPTMFFAEEGRKGIVRWRERRKISDGGIA